MKKCIRGSLFFVALFLLLACKKGESAETQISFESKPESKTVTPVINETSGIADSKANPGHLWVQEDSGNPPQLYLLAHDGKVAKTIFVKGSTNRDWEDIVLSGNDLYIGDIGDNNKSYPDYTIYQFPEPSASTDTIRNATAIKFTYADGPRDAEAFLVDPVTKDLFLLTKSDNPSKIYKIAYPYSTIANTATAVGSLAYGGVVSATLSPDRKAIIVKTYLGLNYYMVGNNEPIDAALKKAPKVIPYQLEAQGEAVAFANNNSGYYTLSEKGMSSTVSLNFYRKK